MRGRGRVGWLLALAGALLVAAAVPAAAHFSFSTRVKPVGSACGLYISGSDHTNSAGQASADAVTFLGATDRCVKVRATIVTALFGQMYSASDTDWGEGEAYAAAWQWGQFLESRHLGDPVGDPCFGYRAGPFVDTPNHVQYLGYSSSYCP